MNRLESSCHLSEKVNRYLVFLFHISTLTAWKRRAYADRLTNRFQEALKQERSSSQRQGCILGCKEASHTSGEVGAYQPRGEGWRGIEGLSGEYVVYEQKSRRPQRRGCSL